MSCPMRTKTSANKNHPPPKKHKFGTSGQATPSFNGNKFTSLERDERYTTLLQWAFVPDRMVELQHNEGKVIRYDRDYLNMMFSNPYEVRNGHLDGYHLMVEKSDTMTHGFKIDETVEQLCIPGRTVSANVDGRPKRIYRKDMTTLAQIWMIFCLHNVIPNSHISSLPLYDCYLLYCILVGVEIEVARLMAT
ncbi:hypothetical protein Lal_00014708 [Lupinus albus]|nr:hypothetical protein Lal_00014708 [Lupinus albus]